MTKRKTGDFAAHYQAMADKYNEAYIRMSEAFWTEVKKRDLPEHCKMDVNHGDRKLTITKTNIVRAEKVK